MCLGILLLAVSLTATLLHARELLAQGYLHYAKEYFHFGRNSENSLAAAEWAIRLSPFAVSPYLVRSAVLERRGQHGAALEESRKALIHGGKDPYVWLSFAYLKLRLGQMDDELTMALEQLAFLAPRDFWLHQISAKLGLAFWSWGKPEHRALWAGSIKFVLRTDREGFLRSVLIARKEELFCREFRATMPYLGPWCGGALQARKLCYTPPVKAGLKNWCKRNGLTPDTIDG